MVLILGFSLCLLLALLAIPETPLGRLLHRQLVERPLAALSKTRRHHLLFFVIMAAFAIGGGEAFAILGPEVVSAFALDLAIYVDAVLVTYALSAVAVARRSVRWLGHGVRRRARQVRPRRKRMRTAVTARKSANDDDPPPALWAA